MGPITFTSEAPLRRLLAMLLWSLFFISSFALQPSIANAACVGGAPNGLTEGLEECDDNDASNGDFCLTNCTYATCGDAIRCTAADCGLAPALSGPEDCDAGVLNSDTTANACRTTCENPSCGDGVSDPSFGEECDDGDADDTDECPNTCQNAECGDGFTRIGLEQCDDGNAINTDSCVACENAGCGDGFVHDGFEGCDDGDTNSGDGCNASCIDEYCGDGVDNDGANEECDLGGGNTDVVANGCRTDCKLWHCGDGVTDSIENCDDANTDNDDPCRNDCTYPVCGDGFLCNEPGCVNGLETCDDGDTDDGDGCSDACQIEGCGNGIGDPGEQCDSGSSFPPVPVETAGCDADCTSQQCGDGYVNETFGEECDDGNTDPDDGCTACVEDECGDGIVNDDGAEECDDGGANSDVLADACRTDCKLWHCGDGVVDQPENCDDENLNENDACRNNCAFNTCGDGVIDVTEEGCDDGNGDNTDECRNNCIAADCGDGIIQTELAEECDDGPSICTAGADVGDACATDDDCHGVCDLGSPNEGDPCLDATSVEDCGQPNSCDTAGVACDDSGNSDQAPDACRSTCKLAFCGDSVVDNPENCDSGIESSNKPCVVTDVGGSPSLSPPLNCAFAACGDGLLCNDGLCTSGPSGGPEECDDDNLDDGDACNSDCSENVCGDGIIEVGVEECDDGIANSDTAADACRTDCKLWHCGDGVLDQPENCDDGNGVDGDMCPNSCVFPACGDSIVCDDPDCTTGLGGGPETCDDGDLDDNDGCSSDCRIEGCGDGIIQAGEDCDAGVLNSQPPVAVESAICDLNCTTAVCNDGTVNETALEECDDENNTPGDGCNAVCIDEFCGDTLANDSPNEECDLGVGNSDTAVDGCRTNCLLWHCGDEVTDSIENCDEGGEAATCDEDCTFVSCGDGEVNETAGEECDEAGANADAPDACRDGVAPNTDPCTLPRPGDGILDPASGEICDAGPLGDASCNEHACSTGASPESFEDGYNGASCELGVVTASCVDDVDVGLADCQRASTIQRYLDQIADRLEMSEYREDLGNLGLAEHNARRARKRAQRLDAKISAFCPGGTLVEMCLGDAHLPHLIDILIELEGNLAANKP